jgi:acetyl-CoA carboxylase carboxyl transferase subunit alpha
MNPNFLDFEQPIAELEAKIQELRHASHGSAFNIEEEIGKLQEKLKLRTAEIFRALTPWQVSQLARHPQRPYTLDYLQLICDEFHELAGDRAYSDDAAIVGGLARIDGRAVVVIGHQKGRDTKSKIRRNFGMPRPEGYRKALRLMKLAERFKLPLLTFIDTPGAYPGVGAEERGQSEAIARNLLEMAELKIPIICTVIGEGGSGGALAIGVGDRTLMLEYGTYSVISPEGCASILWKTAERAKDAAEALGITAPRLLELGLIDQIVKEPLGGAHRDPQEMATRLKGVLLGQLEQLERVDTHTLLETRYERLRSYGRPLAALRTTPLAGFLGDDLRAVPCPTPRCFATLRNDCARHPTVRSTSPTAAEWTRPCCCTRWHDWPRRGRAVCARCTSTTTCMPTQITGPRTALWSPRSARSRSM